MVSQYKNVVVLGGSYGGSRAAQVLAQDLPLDHRVILIDRNSHANHLYVLPRLSVVGGHEHKAFVPYTNVFSSPSSSSSSSSDSASSRRHLSLHARVLKLSAHTVSLDRPFPELGFHSCDIPFEYAVYALGSHLPAPIDLWGPVPQTSASDSSSAADPYDGMKLQSIQWLKELQERIGRASSVLAVGGGALGIQFATDIASVYPTKEVTLLHSRHNLLPRFDDAMHTEIMKAMDTLNIDVILGERLDIASTLPENAKVDERTGQRIVRTQKGREIRADLVLLCTGQIPNTQLLEELCPGSVNPENRMARVLRTMQLDVLLPPDRVAPEDVPLPEDDVEEWDGDVVSACGGNDVDDEPLMVHLKASSLTHATPFPQIFVIGDAADAFGAINAGHNAYYQGEVAARNIVKLIQRDQARNTRSTLDEDFELEEYAPGLPAIKVSLGLGKAVYDIEGIVGHKDSEPEDLDAHLIWKFMGMGNVQADDMLV